MSKRKREGDEIEMSSEKKARTEETLNNVVPPLSSHEIADDKDKDKDNKTGDPGERIKKLENKIKSLQGQANLANVMIQKCRLLEGKLQVMEEKAVRRKARCRRMKEENQTEQGKTAHWKSSYDECILMHTRLKEMFASQLQEREDACATLVHENEILQNKVLLYENLSSYRLTKIDVPKESSLKS